MLKQKGIPSKTNRDIGVVIYNQTELTIEDITKNLKKNSSTDDSGLENVYEFLSTVANSNGKSGFICIKKNDSSRKKSLETKKSPHPDHDVVAQEERIIKRVGKTTVSSPIIANALTPTKLKYTNIGIKGIGILEENKKMEKSQNRKSLKNIYSNKSQLNSPKNNVTGKNSELSGLVGKHVELSGLIRKNVELSGLIEKSNLKNTVILKNDEIFRERALSPYATSIVKSTGKLPLLQTSKNRIKILKYDKKRKKSSNPKGK